MNVDLFSGDNLNMVRLSSLFALPGSYADIPQRAQMNVTRVASALDGTVHNIRYIFECPDVDPPAPIYFYRKPAITQANHRVLLMSPVCRVLHRV